MFRILFAFFTFFLAPLPLDAIPVMSVIKSVKGEVTYQRPTDSTPLPARAGVAVPRGTTIRVGAGSETDILVTPGSAIHVVENTELVLNDMAYEKDGGKVTERAATVDLTTGTVSALINHDVPEITAFKIKSPQGVIACRGTFYGVSVNNGHTYVKVAEGTVGAAELLPPKKEDTKK